MITIKQYDTMLKEFRSAAATSIAGSYILMTDCLFDDLKTVFNTLSNKGETIYYFFDMRVEVVETQIPQYRWWIVAPGKGGRLK